MQPEKKKMHSTCCPHHWLYRCLPSRLQAMSIPPLTQKLSCSPHCPHPPTSVEPNQRHRQSHHASSCGLPRPNTPLKPTDRSPARSPRPLAGFCKYKTNCLACPQPPVHCSRGLSGVEAGSTGAGRAAPGTSSSGYQEWEQGDHMK